MDRETDFQPLMNPLPPAVAALALAICAVEFLLTAAGQGFLGGPSGIGWRSQALREFAVFGPLLEWVAATGNWVSSETLRLLTYPFVHYGVPHALMALVFLLALGKLVGDRFGNLTLLALWFGSAVAGALVYGFLTADPRPLAGGYPSAYGLVGAYSFLLWTDLGLRGQRRIGAFRLIAVLMALRLIFGLIGGGGMDWVAEIAGFVFGFFATPALAPAGRAALASRLRQR